jgi:hypothetical protein
VTRPRRYVTIIKSTPWEILENVLVTSDHEAPATTCVYQSADFVRGLTRGDQQPGGETGVEHACSKGHCPHGFDELLAGGCLAQVSRGPGLQGTAEVLVLVVRSHHQHADAGMAPGESSGDLDAVYSGKPDVHQHHVRVKLVDHFEGELAGAGVTNDPQVGVRVENLTGAIPVEGMVVDDHNTYDRCLHADQATRRSRPAAAEITHSPMGRTHCH